MAYERSPQYSSSRQPQAQLRKGSIRDGSILWLREHVSEDDFILLETANLEPEALNHPVVVIDVLERHHLHVLICTVCLPTFHACMNSYV